MQSSRFPASTRNRDRARNTIHGGRFVRNPCDRRMLMAPSKWCFRLSPVDWMRNPIFDWISPSRAMYLSWLGRCSKLTYLLTQQIHYRHHWNSLTSFLCLSLAEWPATNCTNIQLGSTHSSLNFASQKISRSRDRHRLRHASITPSHEKILAPTRSR